MKIQEAVASVQNAPGSMYTREDVISLLKKLEVEPSSEFTGLKEKQIKKLINDICEKIEENISNLSSDDVVDLSSAQFSLSGNEIELDSVDINISGMEGDMTDGIADVVEEYFENFGKD